MQKCSEGQQSEFKVYWQISEYVQIRKLNNLLYVVTLPCEVYCLLRVPQRER